MPRPRKDILPPGRYTQEAVIREIEERLAAPPKEVGRAKRLALTIGLGRQPALNKRQDGDTPWTVEDLGRVADFFKAPTGWPFIGWDEAEKRDAVWKKRRR